MTAHLRRVHDDRHAGEVGLGHREQQEALHRRGRVQHALVHVDVHHLRAVLDLLPRDREGRLVVAGQDEAREGLRARHIRPLADVDEEAVVGDAERLEAGEARRRWDRGNRARRDARDGVRDGRDVLRRGPAAAADEVERARARAALALGERADDGRRLVGALVVAAERVGKARVGVERDRDRREPRQLLDVGPQLRAAERAVEADRGEVRAVHHRDPERLDGLPDERAAREVHDRARDHDGDLRARLAHEAPDGGDGGLAVERVEDGLDQQHVAAALDEGADLRVVGVADLVEGHAARAGVVDVGRERERAVHRPDGARDEARALGRGRFVGRLAREAGGGDVDVAHERAHAVVLEGDGLGVERVGREHVGPGREVLAVDVQHGVGLREAQDVVVALDGRRPVGEGPLRAAAEVGLLEAVALEHRAHRAVEHEDAAGEEIAKGVGGQHRGGRVGLTRKLGVSPIRAENSA